MLKRLDKKLKIIYNKHKNDKNPTVPVNTIKKYLKLEGIELDKNEE